jgi:hypothetical protein
MNMLLVKINLTSKYKRELKRFVNRSKQRAQEVKNALNLLVQNPKHPGLHTEKLGGSDIWTIRLSEGNRLFFCGKIGTQLPLLM